MKKQLKFLVTLAVAADKPHDVQQLMEGGRTAIATALTDCENNVGYGHGLEDVSMLKQSVKPLPHYKVLTKPLTLKQIKTQISGGCAIIAGVVAIKLGDVVNRDLEAVLDLMSEKLTGTDLLSDIQYSVVGHRGDHLHINVSGDPALILDHEETRA